MPKGIMGPAANIPYIIYAVWAPFGPESSKGIGHLLWAQTHTYTYAHCRLHEWTTAPYLPRPRPRTQHPRLAGSAAAGQLPGPAPTARATQLFMRTRHSAHQDVSCMTSLAYNTGLQPVQDSVLLQRGPPVLITAMHDSIRLNVKCGASWPGQRCFRATLPRPLHPCALSS